MAEVQELLTKMKDDNYLAHYGVLGMRWGVRRSDAELAAAASRRKQKSLDKLEVRDKKAQVKSKEAEARSKLADAKRKEAETRKLTKETDAKIRLEKARERAEARKEKIRITEEQRKKALADNQQTDTKYSYSDYKRMSDAELRAVVQRLNTEKQYRELNPKPPSTMSKILKTVNTTAKTAKEVYEVADALGLTKNLIPKDQQGQVNKVLNTLAKDKSKKKK